MANYDVESHTQTYLVPGTEERFVFYLWHPMLVRPVMKRLFFAWKTKEKILASLARLMINFLGKTFFFLWKKWSITLNLMFLEKSLASDGFPIRCSKSVCLCFRMLSDNPELITMVLLSQTTPHEHPPTPAPCRWPALVTLLTPHQHVWRCHCDDVISISSFLFDRTLTAVCSTRGSHWS